MSVSRSRTLATWQAQRLRGLVAARNLHRPVSTPADFDVEDATFLLVIDAAEGLVKALRIARMAATDDSWLTWGRRIGVWGAALDALTADFRSDSSAETDRIYALFFKEDTNDH